MKIIKKMHWRSTSLFSVGKHITNIEEIHRELQKGLAHWAFAFSSLARRRGGGLEIFGNVDLRAAAKDHVTKLGSAVRCVSF